MDNCAKCGKELSWSERHAYWNGQLRHGYLAQPGLFKGGVKKEFPEYKDKKLCKSCMLTLLNIGHACQYCGKRYTGSHECKAAAMNNCTKCGKKLGWLERHSLWYQSYKMCNSCYLQYCNDLERDFKNPEVKTCNKCGYFEEVRHERGGVDDLGTYFDESYSTFKCRKFNFDLDEMKYYLAQKCSSYISKEEYEEKCLRGEMEKERVQIVLDFSSLKDVMAKGGIVMPTYNCPKCNAMVDIPEAGKIMFCKYCGTPIKPVDIFDRIKSLL